MTFATPLGLLALVAIPTIIAIHLFRRKFPPRQIAGLFLWQAARQKPEGGGRISKLPITASLLLECLTALALAPDSRRRHPVIVVGNASLVVLLDDSASMSAVNPGRTRAPAIAPSARTRGLRASRRQRPGHAGQERRASGAPRRAGGVHRRRDHGSRRVAAASPRITRWRSVSASPVRSPDPRGNCSSSATPGQTAHATRGRGRSGVGIGRRTARQRRHYRRTADDRGGHRDRHHLPDARQLHERTGAPSPA